MSRAQHIELIDKLRLEPVETEWLEFKRSHCPPKEIGQYLSALANSASLTQEARGYLVLGIDDATHDVVGTTFDPQTAKAQGNQALLPWLTTQLRPRTHFEHHAVAHPDGPVVVFAIAPARGQPVTFQGVAYVRVGSSKMQLKEQPEKERMIWAQGSDWSAEPCRGASLADLDPGAIAKAREQFAVKHPFQAEEVATWDDETFLKKARVLRQGQVTNAAILLLGRAEAATLLAPAMARISWFLKDGSNNELDYEHIDPPFLLAGDRLLLRIRNLTIRELPDGTLFPVEVSQYDSWVIREALHNAIGHQDYQLGGRVTVVEFPDRLLVTNVGSFLPKDVETVIRQDAPQPMYRNGFLARAMVELNLIDTQGGGIKRMFRTQQERWFPLPDYNLEKPDEVAVTLAGRILDERYTRLLMQLVDLSLPQVLLLDKVQKRQRISREDHLNLKRVGLVEGRYPNLMVASKVAKATGKAGQHIRERGLDTQYYLDLLLELVSVHQPVSRADVDEALLTKLPDRLTLQQRRAKSHNLLQRLRRMGKIENRGTNHRPQWHLSSPKRTPE